MTDPTLSIQLWSLRHETKVDAAATVRQVPALGYDGIELAGDYGWAVEEWRKILDETGLKVVGAHIGLEVLEKEFEKTLQFQKAVRNSRLVVPSVKHGDSAAIYRGYAARLNALGARLQKEDATLLYHNHDFEFKPLEDAPNGMEVLLAETDPALVHFEFDTYWIERAGGDAVEYVERFSSRVGAIHAKELRKSDNEDVAAGRGDIDFKKIVPLARKKNWPIIVEYEGENALEVVKESAAYFRGLL